MTVLTSVVAVVTLAAPNPDGAKACGEVVQQMERACSRVTESYVAVDQRSEARAVCERAFENGLEDCWTKNGIAVTEEWRASRRRYAEIREELNACNNRAIEDGTRCASRATTNAGLATCESTAKAAMSKCRTRMETALAEEDRRLAEQNAETERLRREGEQSQPTKAAVKPSKQMTAP